MKNIIIAILILIILAGAGYILWQKADTVEVSNTATSTAATPKLTPETVEEETAEYKIDATYPQFGLSSVDAKIDGVVQQAIAAFKEYPVNPPEFGLPKNEQTIFFEKTYIGPDVISAEILISEYTGGAHPNTIVVGVNVDPKTGKEITLDQALSMTGMTLQQVAAQSLARLKASLGADVIFPEGADPKRENYQTFLISPDRIIFVFQNYQVAPYAAGQQEIAFERKR